MARKGDTRTAKRAAANYTTDTAVRGKKPKNAAIHGKKSMGAAVHSKASIEATKELMSDPDIVESLERSEADLKAGRMKSWSQVKSEL